MNTQELIKSAGARFKHSESKLLILEKYTARLVIAHQDGMWRITPELLSFLRSSPPTVILTDIYDVPIRVVTKDLLDIAQLTYNTIMDQWHTEFNELSKNR